MERRCWRTASTSAPDSSRACNTAALEGLWSSAVGVDAHDATFTTALYAAALHGQVAAVRLLLRRGADPDLARVGRFTPLHAASLTGDHVEVAEALVAAGADVACVDEMGRTACECAKLHQRAQVAAVLEDAGRRRRAAWRPPAARRRTQAEAEAAAMVAAAEAKLEAEEEAREQRDAEAVAAAAARAAAEARARRDAVAAALPRAEVRLELDIEQRELRLHAVRRRRAPPLTAATSRPPPRPPRRCVRRRSEAPRLRRRTRR